MLQGLEFLFVFPELGGLLFYYLIQVVYHRVLTLDVLGLSRDLLISEAQSVLVQFLRFIHDCFETAYLCFKFCLLHF